MKYRNTTNTTLALGGAYVTPFADIELDAAALSRRAEGFIRNGILVDASKAPSAADMKKGRVVRESVSATDVPDAKVETLTDGTIYIDPDDVIGDPEKFIPGLAGSESASVLIEQSRKTTPVVVAHPAQETAILAPRGPAPTVAAVPETSAEAVTLSEQSSAGSFIVKNKNNPVGGVEKSLNEMIDEKSAAVTDAVKTIVDKLDGKKN